MPSAMVRSTVSTRSSTSRREHELGPPELAACAHVPVRRADGCVGRSERRARRVRVHRELQHRARGGGIVGIDADRVARSCSRSPRACRRRWCRPDRRRRGSAARDRRTAARRPRDCRRRSRSGARSRRCATRWRRAHSESSVRNRSSSARIAAPIAVPEQATPGAPLRLVGRAARLGDLAQPGAVGVGPRAASGAGRRRLGRAPRRGTCRGSRARGCPCRAG